MAPVSPEQLDRIAKERAEMFRPRWFLRLFSGRLTPGDTFWIGNYGVLLGVIPIMMLLAFLVAKVAPDATGQFLALSSLGFSLYRLAVLRGLIATTLSTPGPKGWRWFGVFWTLLEICPGVVLAWSLIA